MKSLQEDTYGVVLCGGEGKRLRPLTYYFQKAMIPIGSQQKPLLEYIVRLLRFHGITRIVMLVGYKGEQIKNYFDNGERHGVKITYVWDNPEYSGNGGALLNAYLQGHFKGAKHLLIYYGDILSDIDLTELMRLHREGGFAATLALSPNYRVAVGVAEVKGNEVVGMIEKPPLGKPVTIGILAVKVDSLVYLKELGDERKNIDIMGDFIRLLLERNQRIGAYLTNSYWLDLGTTEVYEKLDPSDVDTRFAFLFQEA